MLGLIDQNQQKAINGLFYNMKKISIQFFFNFLLENYRDKKISKKYIKKNFPKIVLDFVLKNEKIDSFVQTQEFKIKTFYLNIEKYRDLEDFKNLFFPIKESYFEIPNKFKTDLNSKEVIFIDLKTKNIRIETNKDKIFEYEKFIKTKKLENEIKKITKDTFFKKHTQQEFINGDIYKISNKSNRSYFYFFSKFDNISYLNQLNLTKQIWEDFFYSI